MIKARNNPFRTQRVESLLTYQPEWVDHSWSELLERWESLGRFVSVVGGHGTGKTTLLTSLATRLADQGYAVQKIALGSDRTRLPEVRSGHVVLLDTCGLNVGNSAGGHAQRLIAKWRLRRRLERQWSVAAGLIETRHLRGRHPVLLKTRTDRHMLAKCIQRLDDRQAYSPAEIDRLFRRHRGNLRNALRECYDRASQ